MSEVVEQRAKRLTETGGGINSCRRIICVATPVRAPPPVTPQQNRTWLRSSYQFAMEEAWYAGCTSVAIPIMGSNTLGYGFETSAAFGIRAVEDWFYAALSWNKLNQFRTVVFFIEDEPNSTPVLRENAAIRAFE